MILILSNPNDPHAIHVSAKLRTRGASVAWVDHTQYPARARVSFRFENGRAAASWTPIDRGEGIDLGELTAIWHRRPYVPRADDAVEDPRLRQAIVDDADLFLRDLWDAVDCLTVPAPTLVYRRADFKASQLALALRLGLEIPKTLITNDPSEFLRFHQEHDGAIIGKLASPVLNRDYLGADAIRYTEIVSNRDVGYFKAVRFGPVIFQAYVPKKMEVRITIVGNAIFAAEIHSQASRRTKHDWRKYDHVNTPLFPHELPSSVENALREMIHRFGLHYGAIDMIVTPDDRYVFLELNPNGQYLWIEELTGMPITDALCDLLESGASRRSMRSDGVTAAHGGEP